MCNLKKITVSNAVNENMIFKDTVKPLSQRSIQTQKRGSRDPLQSLKKKLKKEKKRKDIYLTKYTNVLYFNQAKSFKIKPCTC
jgi:hypothetical protein